jgi:hypothetical protein
MSNIIKSVGLNPTLYTQGESFSTPGAALDKLLSAKAAMSILMLGTDANGNVAASMSEASEIRIVGAEGIAGGIAALRADPKLAKFEAIENGRAWLWTDGEGTPPFSPQENVSARVLMDYFSGFRSSSGYNYGISDAAQILFSQDEKVLAVPFAASAGTPSSLNQTVNPSGASATNDGSNDIMDSDLVLTIFDDQGGTLETFTVSSGTALPADSTGGFVRVESDGGGGVLVRSLNPQVHNLDYDYDGGIESDSGVVFPTSGGGGQPGDGNILDHVSVGQLEYSLTTTGRDWGE